ncbi:alpha-glucosidase, partial [Rhizobium straminoryzae]
MQLDLIPGGFTLSLEGREILRHTEAAPALFVGHGEERMDMYRGNFEIEDYVVERTALPHVEIEGNRVEFSVARGLAPRFALTVDGHHMLTQALDASINRLWIRIVAFGDDADPQ